MAQYTMQFFLCMQIIKEGLTEEESECWTEIPTNSVKIVPFNPAQLKTFKKLVHADYYHSQYSLGLWMVCYMLWSIYSSI